MELKQNSGLLMTMTDLYVYSEITVPNKHVRDEIGITVSIDVESQNYGWQADPLLEMMDSSFLKSNLEKK
jgi:hypothetical protein